MGIINLVTNFFNAHLGRHQNIDQLLIAKDIGRIKDQMTSKESEAINALKEYSIWTHDIMKRADKVIFDKNGNYVRTEKRWKLPISYPSFINEISLVFLYGRPVKWAQRSEDTDKAFSAFLDLIETTHFDSRLRQCKRLAGAETQSAMLFRVFKNSKGRPDVQIRVLAKSKADDIRVCWDQYENIASIGWGYYGKVGSKTIYNFDIYTPKIIYRCKQMDLGWEVIEEENLIGKIPFILFEQDKEWSGIEPMIEREEYVASRTADTNDYFADPIAILDADIIKNMPEKKEEAKLLITKNGQGVDNVAKYLTWDSAPESKKMEVEWLQKHILSKSFTPNIDFDNMKGLSNVSGKALKQMMILADIKASKHKETHDELLKRVTTLGLSIIGNVLNISLKAECERTKIGHEYQEPFAEDITEVVNNLVKLKDSELMSQEGAVELNPLVKDPQKELQRLKNEKKDAAKDRSDMFRSNDLQEVFKPEEKESQDR